LFFFFLCTPYVSSFPGLSFCFSSSCVLLMLPLNCRFVFLHLVYPLCCQFLWIVNFWLLYHFGILVYLAKSSWRTVIFSFLFPLLVAGLKSMCWL
jgi:hypothetical protein